MQPSPLPPPATDAYRDILAELVGIGMEVARLIQAETRALAADDRDETEPAARAASVASVAAAFDKASRAVRRTVLLARHLQDTDTPADATTAARRRIIRGVEDAIQRTTSGERSEALYAELTERLDGPELDDDLRSGQTAATLIADICRDLGLDVMPGTHPWKRRTPSDVAILCRMAGPVRHASGRHAANANVGQATPVQGAVRFQPNTARLE